MDFLERNYLRFSEAGSLRKALFVGEIVLLLALITYSDSFQSGFHLDDFHQIVRNVNIRRLENIPKFFFTGGLGSYWSQYDNANWYRPVTQASFDLNYALSGYRVWSYHAFNFLFHILNGLLLYLVVLKVLNKAGQKGEIIPAIISLLFVLHPVQTNAVTYISGRAVVISCFFGLLSFLSYVHFRDSRGFKGGLFFILAVFSFYLSILSKEIGCAFFCLFILYDFIFIVPESGGIKRAVKPLLSYLLLLGIFLFYIYSRFAIQGRLAEAVKPYGIPDYILSESKAFLLYLRLLLLPVNLNADYSLPLTTSIDGRVILSAIIVMLSLYSLFRMRLHRKAEAFLGLWFFIALAPESTFLPIKDIAVEYRLYLPSIGFFAFWVLMFAGLVEKYGLLKKSVIAAIIILPFVFATWSRNLVWADDYTLWSDVVKKSPDSLRAHSNFGRALLNKKRYGEALDELSKASTMPFASPKDLYLIFNDIGQCYVGMDMPEKASIDFKKAIKINPDIAEAYNNIGLSYLKEGRSGEAEEVFKDAARLEPGFDFPHTNLAIVYTLMGENKKALREILKDRDLNPMNSSIHYKLACIYENNRRPIDALKEARLAMSLAEDRGQFLSARRLADYMKKESAGNQQ